MKPAPILLRIKGLALTRPAQYVDAQGWQCFHLNPEKVDWAESCNNARSQIFPDVPLLEDDPVFDQIMRDREAAATNSKSLRVGNAERQRALA